MQKIKILSLLALTSVSLAGCALQDAPTMQQHGRTTLEIYQDHMTDPKNADVMSSSELNIVLDQSDPFTRRSLPEDTPGFLSNPTLHMYVYPHLATKDQVPIPGYWTVFQLYEKNHYALPGER